MMFTIRRSTAILGIALIGVLGGLALGQVTESISSDDRATASYVSPLEKDIKKMGRNLEKIRAVLGERDLFGTDVTDLLQDIRGNAYGTCENTGGSAMCHN